MDAPLKRPCGYCLLRYADICALSAFDISVVYKDNFDLRFAVGDYQLLSEPYHFTKGSNDRRIYPWYPVANYRHPVFRIIIIRF